MSSIADKDKYVVYHGAKDGLADFVLYERDHEGDSDRPRGVGGITMDPDDVPNGIEYQDHFWVELDEEGEITALDPAPEMHEKMKDDYQEAVEIAKEWEKREKQKWGESDSE